MDYQRRSLKAERISNPDGETRRSRTSKNSRHSSVSRDSTASIYDSSKFGIDIYQLEGLMELYKERGEDYQDLIRLEEYQGTGGITAKLETNVREDVVVVPDRDEEKDLHFDYSDATEKDIVAATKVERSASGLEALKARALALKEKNRQSKLELDEARREQNEEAQRALEIKNAAQAKEKEYQDSLSKLEDYCEALEKDTEINMNLAAVAKTDIECNRRFIEGKQAEIEDFDQKMDEIDSTISPEAINVRPRR